MRLPRLTCHETFAYSHRRSECRWQWILNDDRKDCLSYLRNRSICWSRKKVLHEPSILLLDVDGRRARRSRWQKFSTSSMCLLLLFELAARPVALELRSVPFIPSHFMRRRSNGVTGYRSLISDRHAKFMEKRSPGRVLVWMGAHNEAIGNRTHRYA